MIDKNIKIAIIGGGIAGKYDSRKNLKTVSKIEFGKNFEKVFHPEFHSSKMAIQT